MFQATSKVFIRHRRFLCLLRRILSLMFGSLWLVFPASRILHENLEPGGPSSFFLLPVPEFHASPLPPKRMLPPKKEMGKREYLIAGDHYAIAAIECLPGSARFVDPVFGQLHVLGQSNFYRYKFFLGRGQATLQVKVFSWSPFGNQLFWFTLQIWILRTLGTTPYQQCLLFTWLGVLERKIFVKHVLHVARIQSFKPRPNSHELGIVGSVRTSSFLIKGIQAQLEKKIRLWRL